VIPHAASALSHCLQLTRLLEPALTGAARTLVIVTASTLPLHREQTLATLR
jgi:hypothetical protein